MRQLLPRVLSLFLSAGLTSAAKGRFLFVWAGDDAKAGSDFLAVLDADPARSSARADDEV